MPSTPAKIESLADRLSPAFRKAAFRVDRSRPLTFVCGGMNRNGVLALRFQFLEELKRAPQVILPVLSERAFPHQLIEQNLQRFEEFLASAADCVLIFVESPGSFAETGLFAGLKLIVKKTLIINTYRESQKDSFLNHGPIKLIRKTSRFDAVINLADNSVTAADSQTIISAILRTYPKYDNALVFHPENRFIDLDLRLQLACVHMAVTLIHAGSESLVTALLRKHFRAVEVAAVERFLSVLTSINLLQRQDEIYFNPNPDAFNNDVLINSADFSVENVKAQALEWQAENNSQVATFLREQRGVGI